MSWPKTTSSNDVGLVRVHRRLDLSELFESLGAGDELLWLDTYCPDNAEFFGKILPALKRGAKIKMLIIDPRCANSNLRADETREDVDVFVRRVSSIRCTLRKCGLKEESCQILTHDELPCMPMYIVTHGDVPVRGFSGFFLAKPCEFFTHLEWTAISGGVLEDMHEYFQQKWERNLQRTTEFLELVTLPARAPEVWSYSRPKRVGSLRTA